MGLLLGPRVDQQSAGGFEIENVTRHHMKPMAERRGCNQAVAGRNDPAPFLCSSSQLAPDMRRLSIDRQNPGGIIAFQRLQPTL